MYQYIPLNIFTWVLLFPLILSLPAVSSDPHATAGTGRLPTTTLVPTFVQVMESLSSYLNDSNRNFAVTNFTPKSSPPFYVLVQCYLDLSLKDCLVCYAVSRTTIPECLPTTSGRIYLDGCFVRYDNYSFFQEAIDPATDATNCNSSLPEGGSFDFNRSVVDLVGNVIQRAVRYGGFGSTDLKGVYGLAQCWDSLSNEECSLCLNKARSEAISCLPSAEGRVMNAGCFLTILHNQTWVDLVFQFHLILSVYSLFIDFIFGIMMININKHYGAKSPGVGRPPF
ncbi:putative non-specific serine/threonine protein kinase [Helianthus anomalus]